MTNAKTVILLSGSVDSTVLLAQVANTEGSRPILSLPDLEFPAASAGPASAGMTR